MNTIKITFGIINVNSINSSSGVFFGSNFNMNFVTTSKSNNGFTVTGDQNELFRNLSIVKDENGFEVIKTVT
ncbi:hypothetical protein J7E38_10545 [Bacillus sp. ISL-35]|uniref:hypothetical protein n=1 Tax=Bacillus sp. ISL-35 TaxID=2819122 RepID=UPI001BEAC4BD|nr:hypothetical protein [Bacillus sp. ISL-35]MBT2679441.1 hypothetical protein [Bacillus sp. ISL-35]MBT2703344.1 hypothetical protein [Chryseobacterium sp. ISL-80]